MTLSPDIDDNSANGALVKLLMAKNNLGTKEAGEALGQALANNSVLKELDVSDNHVYKSDGGDAVGFANGLADGVKNNGALVKLTMAKNRMATKEAGEALGEMLKHNTVLKELDVSENAEYFLGCNYDGPGFAKGIAVGVSANGALTSLNISSNSIGLLTPPDGWSNQYSDQSGQWRHIDGREQREPPAGSKPEGVIALADGIKNNGAMVTANIMGNKIGKEQLSKLQAIMNDHPTLVSLCGIADNATEANLSSLGMDADDAAVLADELPAKGALVSANLLNNNIGAEQAQKLATILKEHATLKSLCGNKGDETELDMSGKKMGPDGAIMLAPEIVANGTLALLNISNNQLVTTQKLKNKDAKVGMEFEGGWTATSDADSDGLFQAVNLSGIQALAKAIKNNGALTNLHIGNNRIPVKNMNEIIATIEAKPTMKVLCAVPFRDKTIAELNVSGQSLGVEGALVIRRYLENNGALTSLNVSNNALCGINEYDDGDFDASGVTALAESVSKHQ